MPLAFFPFSGWKASFFGVLHGQSHHAGEFFTQTKVVIERWPVEWSRKFWASAPRPLRLYSLVTPAPQTAAWHRCCKERVT